MATFVAAFIIFAVLFAGMAVGVILANKPLKGSCGGLNALGMKQGCEVCGGDDQECDRRERERRGKGDAARLGRNVLEP
jgi:hypothetical protein